MLKRVRRRLAVRQAVARHRAVGQLLALEQERGHVARRRAVAGEEQRGPRLVEVAREHLAVGAEVGVRRVARGDRLPPRRGERGRDGAGERLVLGRLDVVRAEVVLGQDRVPVGARRRRRPGAAARPGRRRSGASRAGTRRRARRSRRRASRARRRPRRGRVAPKPSARSNAPSRAEIDLGGLDEVAVGPCVNVAVSAWLASSCFRPSLACPAKPLDTCANGREASSALKTGSA